MSLRHLKHKRKTTTPDYTTPKFPSLFDIPMSCNAAGDRTRRDELQLRAARAGLFAKFQWTEHRSIGSRQVWYIRCPTSIPVASGPVQDQFVYGDAC